MFNKKNCTMALMMVFLLIVFGMPLQKGMYVVDEQRVLRKAESAMVPEPTELADLQRGETWELPVWDTGFKWVYQRTAQVYVDPDGHLNLVDKGDYVVSEIGFETTYMGVEELVYNVTIYNGEVSGSGNMMVDTDGDDVPDRNVELNIDSAQSSLAGFLWYRVSDLAIIRDYRDLHIVVNAESGLFSGVAVIDAENSLQTSPGEEDYDFPLHVQDAWNASFIYNNTVHYALDLPDWMNNFGMEDTVDNSQGDTIVSSQYWCNNTESLNNGFGTYDGCYKVHSTMIMDDATGEQDWWYYPPAKNYARWHMENFDFDSLVIENSNTDLLSYEIWDVTATGVSIGENGRSIAHPGGTIPVFCDFSTTDIRFDSSISSTIFSTENIEGDNVANITVPMVNDNTIIRQGVPDSQNDCGSHGLLVKTAEGSYIPKTLILRRGDVQIQEGDVQLSTDNIVAGEPLTITVQVHNTVDTFIGKNVEVSLILDRGDAGNESVFCSKTIYGMGNGPLSVRELEMVWDNPIQGNHTISVVLDPGEQIDETDEGNNLVELGAYYINTRPTSILVVNRTSAMTGEEIFFNASSSQDMEGGITAYEWDFGDGNLALDPVVSHIFVDDGIYNVTLTVKDERMLGATAWQKIIIMNRAPILVAEYGALDGGNSFGIGDEVIFDASKSFDLDGSISTYKWDLDGRTFWDETFSHAFTSRADYTIEVNITDDDGATAGESFVISVENKPPIISLNVSSSVVSTYESITFDATGTMDSDAGGSIVSYHWDFKDETTATGQVVTHSFENPGIYCVLLTVTDNEGGTATELVTIKVVNQLPVVVLKTSGNVMSDEKTYVFSLTRTISLDASGSTDGDGEIVSYFFDPGAGTDSGWTTESTYQLKYSGVGEYDLVVKVKDDGGDVSESVFHLEIIHNEPPTCIFTYAPGSPLPGEKVTFTAVCEDADGDSITGHMWNFGMDNAFNDMWIPNNELSVSFPGAGVYNITLKVKDAKGLQSTTYHISLLVSDISDADGDGLESGLPPWVWLLAGIILVGVVTLIVILVMRKKGDGDVANVTSGFASTGAGKNTMDAEDINKDEYDDGGYDEKYQSGLGVDE